MQEVVGMVDRKVCCHIKGAIQTAELMQGQHTLVLLCTAPTC